MRKQEKEPFLPYVSVDDILEFDSQRPETYTESKLINAILRAIDKTGVSDAKSIASFLALDERLMNYGIRLACGMTFTDLRSVLTIKVAAQMYSKDPANPLENVASRLGLGNRSSVWFVLNKKKFAHLVERLCPDLKKNNKPRNNAEE